MHIEKFYFTLPEVLERWSMSEADLVYLAENDVLRLSVRVYDLPIKYRPANAGTSRRPRPRRQHVAGLLDLHAEDVFNLFRCGEINAYEFRCPKLGDVDLPTGDAPVFVLIGDLVIRRDERDRFEIETGFSPGGQPMEEATFIHSADYLEVRCNGCSRASRSSSRYSAAVPSCAPSQPVRPTDPPMWRVFSFLEATMTTTFYEHWRDVPDKAWRWTNFSPAEIACRGTGKLLINEPALDKLQVLRDRLGKPLIVRSG